MTTTQTTPAVRQYLPTITGILLVALSHDEHIISPSKRILLVDDNTDATEMLRDMLTDLGYQVVVAYDGPQALAALEQFQADVAVIDIGLPVMDGYELARQIRSGQRVPRVIAMTGYGQPADRVRSRQAGFDDHLVKPVDMAALIAVIHRAEPLQKSSERNGDADRE